MTSQNLGIQERYVGALFGNLADDSLHHQTDLLAAVALSSDLGSLLFRSKYGENIAGMSDMVAVWRHNVMSRLAKRGHNPMVCDSIADTSLGHWLNSICRTCHGRQFDVIENCPVLSEIVCPDCNGTGEKKLNCAPEIRGLVLDRIEELQKMERQSGAEAIKKLVGEVRF